MSPNIPGQDRVQLPWSSAGFPHLLSQGLSPCNCSKLSAISGANGSSCYFALRDWLRLLSSVEQAYALSRGVSHSSAIEHVTWAGLPRPCPSSLDPSLAVVLPGDSMTVVLCRPVHDYRRWKLRCERLLTMYPWNRTSQFSAVLSARWRSELWQRPGKLSSYKLHFYRS